MTGSSPPSPPAPLGLSKLARLERAAAAMERGHGVILRTETAAALVLGAELATPARLAALRQLGAVHLFLTPQRAKILRLRLYTEEAIALSVGADWEAGFIRGLADPAADMGFAFRGPLQAERGPLPPLAGAALKLAHLAGLLPAALTVALKPDTAAALALETGFDLLDADLLDAGTWDDVWAGAPHEMEPVANARLPIADNEICRLMAFRPRPREAFGPSGGGTHHYALLVGKVDAHKPVLVRLHSECFTGDLLGSLKCDCGDQLRGAIRCMAAEGSGIVLYLRQEGRGIGLLNKLRAYRLQDQGFDTVDANERLGFPDDLRSFAPAAAMLRALDIRQVRLLTNNPRKVEGLKAEGIDVIERVAHDFPANPHNAHYLATKAKRSGHFL